MPRGKRKRGAWDCRIWFEDGSWYRLTSQPDRAFTNHDIAESIRKNLLPLLEVAEKLAAAAGSTPQEAPK